MLTYCPNCERNQEFRIEERIEDHVIRGVKFTPTVEVEICCNCGEVRYAHEKEQKLIEGLYIEYRRKKGLLFPEDIRAIRERYGLSQRSFGTLLGAGEITINRYEKGSLQDELHDSAIRFLQEPANMHILLSHRGHLLPISQRDRALTAVADQVEARTNPELLMPRGVTEATGFREFSYERFATAIRWFATNLRAVPTTKMNKLAFYADFLNFKTSGTSLTGAAYVKLQYGPVPSRFGTLNDIMQRDGYICISEREYEGGYMGYEIKPNDKDCALDFSEGELLVLARVAAEFSKASAKAISDRSHSEKAWIETPGGRLINYSHSHQLSLNL